jgi:aminoglycoside phosphotransferase (APT) family kinase protein
MVLCSKAHLLLPMEAHIVEFLPPDQLPESMLPLPTADQILAICQRAFGASVHVASARQLGGGTVNTSFLITLDDRQVILRIAPPETADLACDEPWLLRREQHIQPFFAALAPIVPRTILADFTHQLIDRDYVFQTYLVGDRWDTLADQFTPDEELRLWEQFGRITKTIHSTVGTTFGGPHPAPEFPAWSQAILARLEHAAQAMIDQQLDVTDLRTVLAIAQRQTARLDAIGQPRLLHGDLWLFNILVRRAADGPTITGILDAERAWWGDPWADWTMFVLAKAAAPETQHYHARFWQAYEPPEQTPDVAFRQAVYEAMHIGTALAWASQHEDTDTMQRGKRELKMVAKTLPTLV